jgi:hypothetical protein
MPRIQVQRDEYHQTIANKIRDLREYSVQEYERALSTKWDPKALSREVEAAMPESPLAGAIQSSDLDAIGDHRSELVYKALDVLKTDYDAYKALRVLQQRVDSFYQYLDSLESPRDIEEEYADYESNARALEADATKGVLDVLNGAIDRSAGFSSDVVLEPQGSEDSWDKPPRTYQVFLGKSSYAPSFTLFLKDDGSVDSVEDILEGGDDDFFKDPKQQYDYFNLVNEIRKPGSTSKGKILRLYTARPIKDRSRYESATTVPINIFMASTFEEAHGLATDLGGSEQRDVWKVSIDSRYLVQTLEGSVKHYQTVGEGRQVPVKSIELVSPGHRQGADRKVYAKRANLSWVGSLIAIDLEEVDGRPMISMSTTVGTPKIRLDEMDKLVSINRVRGWDVQKSQSKPGHVSWVIDSVDFDRVRSFCGSLLRYVDAYAEKLMPVASRVSSARSCHMRKKANSHTLEWRDENCLMSIWEEESKDMVRLFIRTRDKNLRLDELDEVLDFLRRKGFEVIVSQSVRGFIMWSIYETRIDKLKALGDSLFDTLSAYVETMTSDSAIRVASRFIQRRVET